jgi:hypothetical protein
MMTFNQLKNRFLLYGSLTTGAGILIGVLTLPSNGESAPVQTAKGNTRIITDVGRTVLSEMDARFRNAQDPLNARLFTVSKTYGQILASRPELRESEARGRVKLALADSFNAAGVTEKDPRKEAAHLRAASACADWLLNGETGNSPTALLEPTVNAYNKGDYATAEQRCTGAIVSRVMNGELPHIIAINGLA